MLRVERRFRLFGREDVALRVQANDSADPDESRFIIMGQFKQGRLLVVAYTERSDTIRIISAPDAARPERKTYAEEIWFQAG